MHPGGILVTRSFGDFYSKVPQLGGIKGSLIPKNGDISYLQATADGLQRIILGSDGLWDALTIDEIDGIIKVWDSSRYANNDQNSARVHPSDSPCIK